MAVKFFMLQSHYSSTLDLTDDALLASEKGYKRLMESLKTLGQLNHKSVGNSLDLEVNEALDEFMNHMCDDFNTPRAIASLFEVVTKINSFNEGHLDLAQISDETFARLKKEYPEFIDDVLGLKDENIGGGNSEALDGVMELVLDLRQEARANKDWGTADKIRDGLSKSKIVVKDVKDGTNWTFS